MALCYRDHDPCEYSSLSSNIVGEEEESLLSSYQHVTSEFFTGVKSFRKCCLKRERDVDGSVICNEYVAFTGVSLEDMMLIDRAREGRGPMPKMCCLYDEREEVLIIKLMVGIGHEAATRSFNLIFRDKLKTLGLRDEVVSIGTARIGDERRQKEPDASFKPLGTRLAEDAWPSLTFEVGFLKSLTQLRLDAKFWLTRSHLQTNIVIIIHINKVGRKMELERWEVIDPQCPHHSSVSYSPIVRCVQRILLGEGHLYRGPPLELSVAKVLDMVPPNIVVGALDMTALELQSWNDLYWRILP